MLHGSWHWIFWFLAAFAAASASPRRFFLEESHPAPRRSPTLGHALGGFAPVAPTCASSARCWSSSLLRRLLRLPRRRAFRLHPVFRRAGAPVRLVLRRRRARLHQRLAAQPQAGRAPWPAPRARLGRAPPRKRRGGAPRLRADGFGGFAGVFLPIFCMIASVGLIASNASAVAMEPFGARAGGASSLLGASQSLIRRPGQRRGRLDPRSGPVPMAIVIAACASIALGAHFVPRPLPAAPKPGTEPGFLTSANGQ